MEKVIYVLWRESNIPRPDFNRRLLDIASSELMGRVHGLRVNVQDEYVNGGTAPRYASTSPQMEAIVQVWVDTALDRGRAEIDSVIAKLAPRYSAWLTCESTQIRNESHKSPPSERTPAYSHIAIISVPPRLTWAAWRDLWQTRHTQVAIDTQANIEYVQNLIVRPLTYAAPDYAAIIEECFPLEALTDETAFYGTAEPQELKARQERLYQSTFSFVEEGYFDLIPVSQYDLKPLLR